MLGAEIVVPPAPHNEGVSDDFSEEEEPDEESRRGPKRAGRKIGKEHGRQQRQPRKKQPNKDYTSIAKVIMTPVKDVLQRFQEADMEPYFRVRPYKLNPRNLWDFELPVWFVEQIDQIPAYRGVLSKFKQHLRNSKEWVIQYGRDQYGTQPRLATYLSYAERIFGAMLSGEGTEQRLRMLYCRDIAHLGNASKQLKRLQGQISLASFD